MLVNFKNYKITGVLAAIVFAAVAVVYAQDDTSVHMGHAIQNYLEGNIEESIENLAGALESDPDHERAKDLLERASGRLIEQVRENGQYEEALEYFQMAIGHYPDSEKIKRNIAEVRQMAGIKDEGEPEPEPEPEPDPEPGQKPEPSQEAEQYRRQVQELNRQLSSLQSRLNQEIGQKQTLKSEIDTLRTQRSEIEHKLSEMEASPQPRTSIWVILIIIGSMVLLGGFIYIVFKTETLKVVRNIIKERRDMEQLKSSYSTDTEKLTRKLEEYGRSYQRAEKLEENWEKVIKILQSLTKGGSTSKVVLPEGAGGRKAVTGVDPRVRARADSVEVIAEIFKDSPKAPEMLRPFLTDEDNRTKANAAVAYYRYDPEKAMTVLKEMSESTDKWMRLSAAWALGEIGSSTTARVLEKLLDDSDGQVKNRARISLEKIMQDREEESSEGNNKEKE